MKKIAKLLCSFAIIVMACFIVACKDDTPDGPSFHKVTFMNGDTQIAYVETEEEFNAKLNNVLTAPGKKCTGWYLDAACTQPLDVNNLPQGDFIVYVGWEDLNLPNTLSLSVDFACSGIGTVNFDFDLYYRLTDEGLDFVLYGTETVVDSVEALVSNIEIYYVDGTIVLGTDLTVNDEPVSDMEYDFVEVGTVASFLEIPEVKAVYDFIVGFCDDNNITSDSFVNLLYLSSNADEFVSCDLAEAINGIIDFLKNNTETVIYDYIVESIVDAMDVAPEQKDAKVAEIKANVDTFLAELFDDEITVEGFLDKLLSLIGPDVTIGSIIESLNNLQEKYHVETQEVLDLITAVTGNEFVEAEEGQSLIDYVFANSLDLLAEIFEEESIFDVKLVDLISFLIGTETPISLEELVLPIVHSLLDELTFGDLLLETGLFGHEGYEIIIEMLNMIYLDKLELHAGYKTNEGGILTEASFGFDGKVTITEDFMVSLSYAAKGDVALGLSYVEYTDADFAIPEQPVDPE